jgi:NAD(P)H-hydrate epimerase
MIEVDRAMVEDFRIDLVRMMENAGRALAHLGRIRFLNGDPRGRKAIVLAGTGGNGGGTLVCARRLHAWGADVRVFLSRPPGEFTPVPAQQLEILRRMEVPFADGLPPAGTARPDLVVDGVIGYSLKGPPGGTAAGLIRWANGQDTPVLALDVPSGFDAATGAALEPAVRAAATLTLALPKEGLRPGRGEIRGRAVPGGHRGPAFPLRRNRLGIVRRPPLRRKRPSSPSVRTCTGGHDDRTRAGPLLGPRRFHPA